MQPELTGRFYDSSILNKIDLAYKKAECVITVSEFSKKLLQLYYPDDKEICVLYPPVLRSTDKRKSESNHVLFVGSDHPRKNLVFFLESIALLRDLDLKVSIVCRLSGGKYYDTVQYLIKKTDLKNITLYEDISTQKLNELYASASVFCFPTFAEGFGMPPVEAQMHGVPVLASDIPICHEVLGDSCMYCNPLSTIDMADKIRVIIKNEETRAELVRKGYENAKKYDIDDIVNAQFEIYRKLLK